MNIEDISQFLGKLWGLPGYVLVLLFAAVSCRVLRNIKSFPNDGIPVVAVLIGMVLNGLIADPASDSLSYRQWIVKNAVVGGIIGYIAFFAHDRWLRSVSFLDSNGQKKHKKPK